MVGGVQLRPSSSADTPLIPNLRLSCILDIFFQDFPVTKVPSSFGALNNTVSFILRLFGPRLSVLRLSTSRETKPSGLLIELIVMLLGLLTKLIILLYLQKANQLSFLVLANRICLTKPKSPVAQISRSSYYSQREKLRLFSMNLSRKLVLPGFGNLGISSVCPP